LVFREDRGLPDKSLFSERRSFFGTDIEVGMVGLSVGLMSNAANPYGGVRQSGFGREGPIYGAEGYLRVKAVTLGLR
jgi:succinate-semialdehyde dehydrogenase / glutarate-semialdehyde dehydrogenase